MNKLLNKKKKNYLRNSNNSNHLDVIKHDSYKELYVCVFNKEAESKSGKCGIGFTRHNVRINNSKIQHS